MGARAWSFKQFFWCETQKKKWDQVMPFTFTYFGLLTHVHETLDTYSSPQIPSCSFPAVLPKNSLALPQPLGLGSSCPHAWCSFALLIIQWSFRSHQFRNKNIKNSTKIQVIPVRPYQFPLFQKKTGKQTSNPQFQVIPGCKKSMPFKQMTKKKRQSQPHKRGEGHQSENDDRHVEGSFL